LKIFEDETEGFLFANTFCAKSFYAAPCSTNASDLFPQELRDLLFSDQTKFDVDDSMQERPVIFGICSRVVVLSCDYFRRNRLTLVAYE